MNGISDSSVEGSENRILGDLGVMAVHRFHRIRIRVTAMTMDLGK